MEIQLQELIEQIKTDGVAAAEAEAAAKLEAADTEAQRIIAEANAEAAKLLHQAKEENERMVRSGEDAIRQAGRNLLISFRESVVRELDAIIGRQVSQACAPDALVTLIPGVLQAWAANTSAEDLTVLLSSKDLAAVEESLLAALKDRMLQGVTLKADEQLSGGFRIAAKDGGAYYDFSAQAVAEMFSAYLNPKVSALLKEAGNV